MKKFWRVNDSAVNQISYYHILLFFICLPLDRFFSEIVLVSLAIHTFINLKKADLKAAYDRRVLVLQSIFFVTVFSTVYTTDLHNAFNDWGMQVDIFLIPLLFALHRPLVTKYKDQLLNGFAASCVAVSLVLFGVVFRTIRYFHLPLRAVYSSSFVNHNFSKPVGIHATFFSVLLVAATIILFQNLLNEKRKLARALLLFGGAVLFAALIQLSSKSAIISLVIVGYIFVPLYLFKGRKRVLLLAGSVVLTILGALLVLRYESLKTRLFSDMEADVNMNRIELVTDSRLDRWKVTLETARAKPILGYGTGTEDEVVQQAFFKHKLYHSFIHRLNAHNEFLSILIKSGAIGLAVYLFVLGYCLTVSVRDNNLLLTTCVILLISTSIAENALDANKGIYFYGAFFSLLLLSIKTSPKAHIKRQNVQSEATLTPAVTC
ncbi:O-antigen ligase family protein [Mucilaginibacter agri]|uniref:O-antigen ligase-related domain-containing protein n=1 Tax=Mucilaginibacter agri TaxID=2695265 RepID=A0A965ZDH6_9SPHI|nr:O-antigen ligase family protein [Mucilaginibacter agri]NCD69049.1 hypothetical protein [Mucilaginibacter agri]